MKILPIKEVPKDVAKNPALYGSWGEIASDDEFLVDSGFPVTVVVHFPDFPKEQIVIGADTNTVRMTDGKTTTTYAGETIASELEVLAAATKINPPLDGQVILVKDQTGTYKEPPKDNKPHTMFCRITSSGFHWLDGKTIFVPVKFHKETGRFSKYAA